MNKIYKRFLKMILILLVLIKIIESAPTTDNGIIKSIETIFQENNQFVYINTDTAINHIDTHFLSFILDPLSLPELPWADPRIINLARQLSPAWLKISPDRPLNISLYQWAAVNHFTSEANIKQIWESHLFAKAVNFWLENDFLTNNTSTINVLSVPSIHKFPPVPHKIGFALKLTNLNDIREIIRVFPNYKSPEVTLIGPEVPFFQNFSQVEQFAYWLLNYSNNISYVSWKPSALYKEENNNIISTRQSDNFKLEYKIIHDISKKLELDKLSYSLSDITIETRNGGNYTLFEKTLVWMDRLCSAAIQPGIKLVFHSNLLPLHKRGMIENPAFEYWIAVLFKRLTGSVVLNVKSRCEGQAQCRIFSFCTPTNNENGLDINAGSVTIIGINMYNNILKGNISNDSTSGILYELVLTSNENNQILLNGEKINMNTETGKLPIMSAKKYLNPSILLLPRKSIVFWIFPLVNAFACINNNNNKKGNRLKRSDIFHPLSLMFPLDEILEEKNQHKRCGKNLSLKRGLRNNKLKCPPGCYSEDPDECNGNYGFSVIPHSCTESKSILQKLLLNLGKLKKNKCCCCPDEEDAVTERDNIITAASTSFTRKRLADENTEVPFIISEKFITKSGENNVRRGNESDLNMSTVIGNFFDYIQTVTTATPIPNEINTIIPNINSDSLKYEETSKTDPFRNIKDNSKATIISDEITIEYDPITTSPIYHTIISQSTPSSTVGDLYTDTNQRLTTIGDSNQPLTTIGDSNQRLTTIGDSNQRLTTIGDSNHPLTTIGDSQIYSNQRLTTIGDSNQPLATQVPESEDNDKIRNYETTISVGTPMPAVELMESASTIVAVTPVPEQTILSDNDEDYENIVIPYPHVRELLHKCGCKYDFINNAITVESDNLRTNNVFGRSDLNNKIPLEDCMIRCVGTKYCNENNFYSGLSSLIDQLKDGDEQISSEILKNNKQLVNCPSECLNTPCRRRLNEKMSLFMSIMSWLKDVFNRENSSLE